MKLVLASPLVVGNYRYSKLMVVNLKAGVLAYALSKASRNGDNSRCAIENKPTAATYHEDYGVPWSHQMRRTTRFFSLLSYLKRVKYMTAFCGSFQRYIYRTTGKIYTCMLEFIRLLLIQC